MSIVLFLYIKQVLEMQQYISVFLANMSFAQTMEFNNPIDKQHDDPWVYKTENGTYYLIATVPEYDQIVLRKTNRINRLKDANEKVIWRKHEKGVMGEHIWAPELHRINGKIFVTFSASATNHNYCVGLLWIDENEN